MIICNINDASVAAEKEQFISEIAHGLHNTWKSHVDWSVEKWREIVLHRLQASQDKFVFTVVAYEENYGKKEFIGTLSIERGCPEANDTNHSWLCGWYVKPEKRSQGLALAIAEHMLEKLQMLGVKSFHLYTVVPELDLFYENLGIEAKEKRVIEGYPAIIREGSVDLVLENVRAHQNQSRLRAKL